MIAYWALFAIFAIGAFFDTRFEPDLRRPRPFWLAGGLVAMLMVGLRYEVGADWETYQFIFNRAGLFEFWRIVSIGDPGFQARQRLATAR